MICRTFFSPDNKRYAIFTARALSHMYRYAQRRRDHLEAGGEVFTRAPELAGLVVDFAAGPHSADRRGRNYFNPDVDATTHTRYGQFQAGRHAVGLWHTHPEVEPRPSCQDRTTTFDYFHAFREQRDLYILVIVGNRGSAPRMTVWAANDEGWVRWAERHESSVDRSHTHAQLFADD